MSSKTRCQHCTFHYPSLPKWGQAHCVVPWGNTDLSTPIFNLLSCLLGDHIFVLVVTVVCMVLAKLFVWVLIITTKCLYMFSDFLFFSHYSSLLYYPPSFLFFLLSFLFLYLLSVWINFRLFREIMILLFGKVQIELLVCSKGNSCR